MLGCCSLKALLEPSDCIVQYINRPLEIKCIPGIVVERPWTGFAGILLPQGDIMHVGWERLDEDRLHSQ